MPDTALPGEPFVVALFGPTGVGKTGVAIELGDLLRSCGAAVTAINCDSMQVYSGLEVISGAPTEAERRRLEHRLVSHVPIDSSYSAAAYARDAHGEIDRVLGAGSWPLVVGGTGLYLRAALSDLELLPDIPEAIRTELEEEMEQEGPESMHEGLSAELRDTVHPNDRKRILRYLGLERIGVKPHPDTARGGRLWSSSLRHPTMLLGLVEERDEHERRIASRVQAMAEAGAIEEAAEAARSSISDTAAKAIGFREFLDGDLESVTRRQVALVRRQLTWMNRMEGVTRIERKGRVDREIAEEILGLISTGTGVNASRQ